MKTGWVLRVGVSGCRSSVSLMCGSTGASFSERGAEGGKADGAEGSMTRSRRQVVFESRALAWRARCRSRGLSHGEHDVGVEGSCMASTMLESRAPAWRARCRSRGLQHGEHDVGVEGSSMASMMSESRGSRSWGRRVVTTIRSARGGVWGRGGRGQAEKRGERRGPMTGELRRTLSGG